MHMLPANVMDRELLPPLQRVSSLNYVWSITWIMSVATLIAGVRGWAIC